MLCQKGHIRYEKGPFCLSKKSWVNTKHTYSWIGKQHQFRVISGAVWADLLRAQTIEKVILWFIIHSGLPKQTYMKLFAHMQSCFAFSLCIRVKTDHMPFSFSKVKRGLFSGSKSDIDWLSLLDRQKKPFSMFPNSLSLSASAENQKAKKEKRKKRVLSLCFLGNQHIRSKSVL